MKIIVLNGSPKGDISVTMQYVKYMQMRFAQHEFKIINIAQPIRQIERDAARFDGIMGEIKSADGVLWAFPLYVCLAHANYMRFVELISERGAESAFIGKYTAVLTTSIHFFDHTAHNYMHAVCDDLGMRYTGYFSPAMDDIMTDAGRKKLEQFTGNFLAFIENELPTQRLYAPLHADIPPYAPGPAKAPTDNSGLKVLLISDEEEGDGNLTKMTARLVASFAKPVETVRLRDANIKGGCLGCLKCGFNNECVYAKSDDIEQLYNEKIKNADIVVFAGSLKGRFLSARFKTFIDRRFLNTHQPQMTGKQVAYVVSGALSQNQNTTEVLQAMAELDRANLTGIVTDEFGSSPALDALLDNLAAQLVQQARASYVQPATFLGIAGMKIFRDEIYLHLRFVFQGDHKYYKKHGIYDFPQKQIKARAQGAVMILMTKIPSMKKYMRDNLPTLMLGGMIKLFPQEEAGKKGKRKAIKAGA